MLGPAADRARFEREARAAAALSSPHIVQLYDYGASGARPFMVLEYLGGGTLEDRLPRGTPLPDAETQRIASELAAGLAHAHARGLVHRDLKPANVLFDSEDRAKIADFGIARMGGAGTLTEAGTVLGTASYISPEQASGEPATPASDVYSFGVILFRMLTGRLPFESRNAMELVRMHRDETPPTVHELRADAPQRLEALALAALAKDPAARPPDGGALVGELAMPGETGTLLLAPAAETMATQVVRRPPARSNRRWLPIAIAVAAVLLLAGAGVAIVATGGDDDPEPTLPSASLTLPTVTAESTTLDTSTEETTEPTTTEDTTTEETTTEQEPTTTTTRPTTTAPTTTATTAPTTTEPLPTTTETIPTTTETVPTTTETTPTDTTTTPGATG
jgi:serine/threonine-protein kinase